MLRKLYKHELRSLYGTMLPVYGALCLLTLLSRMCFVLLKSSEEYPVFGYIKAAMAIIYAVGIFAMVVLAFVLIIKRFYTNCFSKEGYLTFSLPFSATEHLTCKLVCGGVVMMTTVLAVGVSLLVMGIGTGPFREICKIAGEMVRGAVAVFTPGQLAVIITLGTLALLLLPFASLLQYYFCIAFGQKYKNRIAAAIITYFVLYAATQVLSTVLVLPISMYLESIAEQLSVFQTVTIFLSGMLGWEVVSAAAFYLVARYEMTHKLNLA